MPCENCLSRREFLARSAAATVGVAVIAAGCGDGQFGPAGVVASGSKVSLKVASVSGLASIGQLVNVGPPDAYVAVKRTAASPAAFVAISTICTHEGCVADIEKNAFHCHCHESFFDNNGRVVAGPALANGNLPTLATQYDAATDTLTIG